MTPGRALVTGAGQRLGQAIAIALGRAGWSVAVHYRTSLEGAEDTCLQIRNAGGTAVPVQADLSDETSTSALTPNATDMLGGPLTLLVNNASLFEPDEADSHSRQEWDAHIETNLRAPVHLSQAFVGQLPDDKQGLIVNMLDQRVWKLNPEFFTYTLAKSALWTATQTMAQAFAPQVRVNGIGPGPTLRNARQSEDDFERQSAATLTGEGASPEEVVRSLFYLIDARAVTGQMIAVDGGQHLVWQTPDVTGLVE